MSNLVLAKFELCIYINAYFDPDTGTYLWNSRVGPRNYTALSNNPRSNMEIV